MDWRNDRIPLIGWLIIKELKTNIETLPLYLYLLENITSYACFCLQIKSYPIRCWSDFIQDTEGKSHQKTNNLYQVFFHLGVQYFIYQNGQVIAILG